MRSRNRPAAPGPTGTTWLSAFVAASAFAVLITFGWIVPRIDHRLVDQPAAVDPAPVGAPTTGFGVSSVGLDPAGPTIAAPSRPESMTWVLPELVLPLVLAVGWGGALAWALWFRPRVVEQGALLTARDHQVEDLIAGLEAATAQVAERESLLQRNESSLLLVRSRIVELERELALKAEAGPTAPRRRATDAPERRTGDEPDEGPRPG